MLDSSGQTSATINGEKLDGLMMVVGSNFGIDKDGIIYTNGGVFSGDIIGGTITSKNYSSDSYVKTQTGAYVLLSDGSSKLKKAREDNYSNNGMMLDLNRGIISTANFYIAEDGSVNIRNGTLGGSHTAGLVSSEAYLTPSVGNENALINSTGGSDPATNYFSRQGIKIGLNNSGFFTSENFAITGDGTTYINGEIRGHLGSSSDGLVIGDSAIYKGTASMTSITPGIYYGTDGFRNFTEDGKYAQIKDGVISSTESITIGSTAGNHMVMSEDTGSFRLGYMNSSGETNTSLEFGSGSAAPTSIVIIPEITSGELGSSISMDIDVYLQKLIPRLCSTYPHRTDTIYIGVTKSGRLGFAVIGIYDTSKLKDGVPEYAWGYVTTWGGGFYTFGYNSYTWYWQTK